MFSCSRAYSRLLIANDLSAASTSSSESADKIEEEFQAKQPLGKSKSDGAKDAVVLRRPRSTGSGELDDVDTCAMRYGATRFEVRILSV